MAGYSSSIDNCSICEKKRHDCDEPDITVDDLKMAQFIYLPFVNEKIRIVIDTMTSKAVLILGRFTPERKAVLDKIHEQLREKHDREA